MNDKSQIIQEQTQGNIQIQQSEMNMNSNRYEQQNNQFTEYQYNNMNNDRYSQFQNQNIQANSVYHQHIQKQENQSYFKEQRLSNEYEQNRKDKKVQFDLQDFAICLQSIEQSITRIYYRKFLNKLISFYIQSLKEQQRKIKQTKQIQIKLLKQQNWPFKQLFYKKFKNQNQQIMFEFINMCAQKIQATFKAYITYKRHKKAFQKINHFKSKLSAIVKGWKTWNIYNCNKVKQIRKNVLNISKQIDLQLQNPNLDRFKKMKKIQYLNSSQQVLKQNFIKSFNYLYNSGTWIYQVQKCFKKVIHQPHKFNIQQKNLNQNNSIQNIQFKNQHYQIGQIKQLKPKTRKRQFQGINKNQNKQTLLNYQNTFANHNQSTKIQLNYQEKSVNSTNYQSSQQDRPIVAKGKYQFTDDDMKNNQNQFLKLHQLQKSNQNHQQNQQNQSSPRINKFKDQEKKKLIKRQKYDPRKAIQQQKKRLQQQKKKIKQNLSNFNIQQGSKKQPVQNKKKIEKKNIQQPKKTPRKIRKQENRKQLQSPRESSKQKTVQKVKKQSKLTKKDDNSKSIKLITNHKKVQSKVNCWGPKKDSSQNQISISQQSSYKSKYLMGLKQKGEGRNSQQLNQKQEQNYKKNQRQMKQIQKYQVQDVQQKRQMMKMVSQIKKRKTETDQQQTYQSNYLKKLVQQKQKGAFSYVPGKITGQRRFIQKANQRKQQSFAQKFQQLNNNIKRLSQNRTSLTNLKNISQQKKNLLHQNSQAQIQAQKKKQQVHRPIQSLQDVYSTQYTDRLNNLKNKLNMLQSTRYIQRDEQIPILLQDSKFIRKIYKDHTFSSLYWPQVRTMQTNFLDYIKFSGF